MDQTSSQIYAQLGDSLITIRTTNGEEFVANIVGVTGGLQVGNKPTMPDSTFLEINRYIDRKPFSKPNLTNEFLVQTIHPDEIAEIQKYIPSI